MSLKEAVTRVIKKTKGMYFDHGAKAQVDKFLLQHKMNLRGDYGFSVNGLMVSEFGYLLREVSGGKLHNFDNFNAIHAAFPAINGAIAQQIMAPVLVEEKALGIAHETALYNMRNLRNICVTISKYVELLDRLAHEREKFVG